MKNCTCTLDRHVGPSVSKQNRAWVGSCNFCPSLHTVVYVVQGESLQVRLCEECMKSLKQQTRKS